jgi:hypothetical protein
VQLVVGGAPHAVVGLLRLPEHALEHGRIHLLGTVKGFSLHGAGHVPQLPLHAAERLLEQPDRLVEPGDRPAQA